MNAERVSAQDIVLLEEVLRARASARVDDLLDKARADTVVIAERAYLRELNVAELASTGLGPDSEPTSRGLNLERLVDVINRPNVTER